MEGMVALDTSEQLARKIRLSWHQIEADGALSLPVLGGLLRQLPHLILNLVHCQS